MSEESSTQDTIGESPTVVSKALSSLREAVEMIAGDTLGLAGLIILGLIIATAIFAPLVAPHDPMAKDFTNKQAEPSLEHPAGTDDAGRDCR